MQPGAKDAGLDADLVGHRDDAALGHRGAEPAALEDGDLGAADDDDRGNACELSRAAYL